VAAMPLLRKIQLPILLDHFGRPDVARGITHPGFQALLELGRSGNAVVKLSGPFHASLTGYPFRDVDPFVAAAIEAFTLDNCIWGSDWPFVPSRDRIDFAPVYRPLERWLPDPKDRAKVLTTNPMRLFGFRMETVTGGMVEGED
jgi:predicted TIM-barrel fold metal-dependent hydrolase